MPIFVTCSFYSVICIRHFHGYKGIKLEVQDYCMYLGGLTVEFIAHYIVMKMILALHISSISVS